MNDCQEMRTDVEERNVTVMFSGEMGKEPATRDSNKELYSTVNVGQCGHITSKQKQLWGLDKIHKMQLHASVYGRGGKDQFRAECLCPFVCNNSLWTMLFCLLCHQHSVYDCFSFAGFVTE